MFPDGEVSGVLMSPWASTQSRPTFFPSRRAAVAMAETVPTEIEWSPPSTRGKRPFPMMRSTLLHTSREARAISPR